MSDYKELPCRRCGHVWKWVWDKKTIPYCPEGYGCREKELDYQMSDYRVDAGTKEEWAERAWNAEDKLSLLLDNLLTLKARLKKWDNQDYVYSYIEALLQEIEEYH